MAHREQHHRYRGRVVIRRCDRRRTPSVWVCRCVWVRWRSPLVPMARSVLEGIGRVVPRLPAGDLEAATDLGVAVDADDLLALGAPPALEPVGRALQVHP